DAPPRPLHNRPATPRSVRHVAPSRAVPPPSVAATDPTHTRSDCLLIPTAGDRCFAGACIPSPGRSAGCPPHDRPQRVLPFPAVRGEWGHFSGRYRTHLSQAHLGDHALETGSGDRTRRGSAQILIHDLDLAPT